MSSSRSSCPAARFRMTLPTMFCTFTLCSVHCVLRMCSRISATTCSAQSMHCTKLLHPVSTILPDVNSSAVQHGCCRRMVMAANFCFV